MLEGEQLLMAVVVTAVTTVPAAFPVIIKLEMFFSHLNFHLRPLTAMFTIEMATTELV